MNIHLIIPAFIAGLLTFLAPCTLPLVPAYLGFISGVSAKDLQHPEKAKSIRRRVVRNGFFYVLGFSTVFVFFGILFGIGGAALIQYRDILERIGGLFVIFFGLFLMGVFERSKRLSHVFQREYRLPIFNRFHPGTPSSSFIFGATFAFGWTPCVGPILGSILLLASSTATVIQGATLLIVFSIGLGIPFMLLAMGVAQAADTVKKLNRVLPYISIIGGLFLLVLGILLVTGSLSYWLTWTYSAFKFLQYDQLLQYL